MSGPPTYSSPRPWAIDVVPLRISTRSARIGSLPPPGREDVRAQREGDAGVGGHGIECGRPDRKCHRELWRYANATKVQPEENRRLEKETREPAAERRVTIVRSVDPAIGRRRAGESAI